MYMQFNLMIINSKKIAETVVKIVAIMYVFKKCLSVIIILWQIVCWIFC